MYRPILVVEDDINDLELTLVALETARVVNPVVTVRDGQDALDFLLKQGAYSNRCDPLPAFIMLDIKMPRLSGLDVLEIMSKHDRLRHVPVIVLTSSREERDIARAYDNGINAYVVKPYDFPHFQRAINEIAMMWAIHNQSPRMVA